MSAWSDGYVSDIEYTHHFYRELAPAYLDFVCLTQGMHPPALDETASYCELGCGQGVGTNLLAAANPHIRFWGIDFNPAQISNARRLAREGGVGNVTFVDRSFEQCLAPEAALPQFDYITLHGIYSWISAENREFIVRFLDRHLKPGGIVYVSYNCLPGWTLAAPLQRLFREHAQRHPERSDAQAKAALEFSRKLADAKAGYFAANPSMTTRLDDLATAEPNYLAHEYLNGHWNPMYHSDVARELDAARLTFVGSATLTENYDLFSVPEKMIPVINAAKGSAWRETLRDYSRNQRFRRDVFMRGASAMKPIEQAEILANICIAPLVSRAAATYTFKTPVGEMKGNADIYAPLLDALAARPHTIRELAALKELANKSRSTLMEAVNLLVHSSQAHPVAAFQAGDNSIAKPRLNEAIAQRIRHGDIINCIAAPLVGTGVGASYSEQVALLAHGEGIKADVREVARFGWAVMQRTGQRLVKDKTRLQSAEENIAELEEQLKRFYAGQFKVWKTLGVI